MLIAQLTDLHMCPPGMLASRMVDTNALTARALRAVASSAARPDVIVLTGDLAEHGDPAEYALLAALLREHLRVPVFVIPGNHDQRPAFRDTLGHLPGVCRDPHFVQYAVEDYPVRLVMLDTHVPGAGHGELCGERLDFLDRALAAAPDRPTIVGMHHPPFACGIAHMDRIALRDPVAFAAVIARHRQVERIICGHVHRPIFGRVAHAIASVAPSVAHQVELNLDPAAAGTFTFEPPGYHLHRWTPAEGILTHTMYIEPFPGPFPFQGAAPPG